MRRNHLVCPSLVVVVSTLLLATDVLAQSRRDSVRVIDSTATVADLVARLPGEAVPLQALLRAAVREGMAGRIATAARRRADGDLLSEGRVLDPTMQLASGVASDLFGLNQRQALSSSAAISAALPWGADVGVSYVRQDGTGLDPVMQLRPPTTLSLSVSQPLLRGLNTRTANLRASRRDRAAADFVVQRTWQEVTTEVELHYWSLAEAQAIEAVYTRSLELSQRMLHRNVELAKRGLIPDVDVLTVRSGVATRQSALVLARQARMEQSDSLVFAAYGARASARLDGGMLPLKAIDTAPLDAATLAIADPLPTSVAVVGALAQRTDVLAARERREAADVRVSLAANAVRPNLALEGGWVSVSNLDRLNGMPAASGGISGWRVGLSVSAPLLNRGDRGRALVARAEQEIEALHVLAIENSVRQDVRLTTRAIQMSRERLLISDDAAQLAARQLEAERHRLDLGLGDSFRVLQTEEYAVNAQLDAVRARYDVLRAQARHRLAAGTTTSSAP